MHLVEFIYLILYDLNGVDREELRRVATRNHMEI